MCVSLCTCSLALGGSCLSSYNRNLLKCLMRFCCTKQQLPCTARQLQPFQVGHQGGTLGGVSGGRMDVVLMCCALGEVQFRLDFLPVLDEFEEVEHLKEELYQRYVGGV